MTETTDKDFEIPPPPGDGGGGSSGGGSGGGSSSGGSSDGGSSGTTTTAAPPEPKDPYTAWYEDLDPREKKRVSIFDSIYTELWGEPAPLAILQAAVNQGMNKTEFEEAQKRNPAWWKTDQAHDSSYTFDLLLSQLGLGAKPKKKKGGGGGNGGGGGLTGGGDADVPPGAMPPGPGYVPPPEGTL